METKGIYKAMREIMAASEAITKDRKNLQQGYMFRGIDDVYNSLHAIMAQHGVFMLTEVLEERSEERQNKSGGALIYRILKIKFTFCAEDGSSVSSIVIGEAMDSGDKASNKALSVAQKYCLMQTFLIPTDDPKDPEIDSPEPVKSKAQIAKTENDKTKARADEGAAKIMASTDTDVVKWRGDYLTARNKTVEQLDAVEKLELINMVNLNLAKRKERKAV